MSYHAGGREEIPLRRIVISVERSPMPLIFRAIQPDGAGPLVGHESAEALGVRDGDLPCENDQVRPNSGGASVSPSKTTLPGFLIPQEMRNRGYPKARRTKKKDIFPWRFGEGEFAAGPLCDRLQLSLENETHGFVEPNAVVTMAEYRAAVEATQSGWTREEW